MIVTRACIAVFLCVSGATAQPLLPPVQSRDPNPPLSQQATIVVKRFRFTGNKVFSDEVLSTCIASFLNKPLTTEQLEDARRAVTQFYIDKGYINSGAVLPDQTIGNGEVLFQIHEGQVTEANVRVFNRPSPHSGRGDPLTGPTEGFFRQRVELTLGQPLQQDALAQQLELLRTYSFVDQLQAELVPGIRPGDAILNVDVVQGNPLHMGIEFNNQQSPSIGAEEFDYLLLHQNLTGHGDELSIRYGITKGGLEGMRLAGIDDISLSYRLPITAHDTTIDFAFSRSNNLVVEEPFDELDIESESYSGLVGIRHPMVLTPNLEFALSLQLERKRNRTFLLGEPFSFSPGANDGKTDVTVLRFVQEYTTRDEDHAFSLRSTVNIGIDALGATENGNGVPDGEFLAWLGQVQYVRRLHIREPSDASQTPSEQLIGAERVRDAADIADYFASSQLIFRVTTQITGDSLLPIEQFSVGGFDSVRGYRENQVVRDNAVVLSLEVRLPLLYDAQGRPTLQLAPFADYGYAWNAKSGIRDLGIGSVGAGIIFQPTSQINLQLYCGHPFRDFDDDENDLQDIGIHFKLTVLAF